MESWCRRRFYPIESPIVPCTVVDQKSRGRRRTTTVPILCLFLTQFLYLSAQEHPAEAFLSKYCLECHDAEVQEGERSFEELVFPIEGKQELIEVQEIIDQLNLGDMPPKKAAQPSDEEVAVAVKQMSGEVSSALEKLRGAADQTILRRLNEREYINTIEDLFARRIDTFGPTRNFPADQTEEHIDTIGDTLVTSSFLLNNYFEAAHQIVEKALNPVEKPTVKDWHFKDRFHQGQELSYSHRKVYNYRYLCIYEVPNTVNHEGGYGGLEQFTEGVHADGNYEVRILAHSMNRDSHYDQDIFRMDLKEPFRLGVVTGDSRAGELHHPQPVEPQLAEVTLADGEPQWYAMKVWLEKGQQPRFIFPNGMANCRNAFGKIAKTYQKEWPKNDPYHKNKGIVESRRVVLEHGKMPHIRIHEVKIRGPIYDSWPPLPQKLVFGEGDFGPNHRRRILTSFAARAYRRSPQASEVDTLVAVAENRIAHGHDPRQATVDAIKAAICSPHFIYLSEPQAGKNEDRLRAHDLAARLSYFLTATMPDAALRKVADSGKILEEKALLEETKRLLAKPESADFYEGFTNSWLNLRELGGMPPDRSASAPWYYDNLETAMRREVQLFMKHLVDTNGPLTDFIDSNYTFLNYPLAILYREPFDFPVEERYQFKRVTLKSKIRGGLLGMGAILTVSANGIETSPVTRGVYLLENVLGTPTPPPPDEVPAIEPDIRGAVSVRQQLEKHREAKTCAECHRKIDPIGFGLEIFDPIGRHRSVYPSPRKGKRGLPIDSSGEFPNGDTFENLSELRAHLTRKKDFFARRLTESLLAYATGRPVGPFDRGEVNEIVEQVSAQGYGAATLLEKVIASDIFRRR